MIGVAIGVLIGIVAAVLAMRLVARRRRAAVGLEDRDTAAVSRPRTAGNDRDSWEGAFWEVREPLDVETRVHLGYTDAQGQHTERVVRTRSFEDRPTGLLIGHCHLRGETRTFRFDRVRQAVDVATGEVVADLRAHLRRTYETSPERARDSLESDFGAVLKVLFYVAKADGQYRAAEKVIVRGYLRELVNDQRLSDDLIDQIFQGMAAPSLQGFKVALARVHSEQLVDPQKLSRACEAIVATQATVSPGEREALEYMERQLATRVAAYAEASA